MHKYLVFFALILSLASCQEVIELELDSAAPQVVAEANLDAGAGVCTVLLSRSGVFYASNSFEKIEGAQVQLRTATGESLALNEMGSGLYRLGNLVITSGEDYGISVVLPDGTSFETGLEKTPVFVALDTLYIQKTASGGPGGPGAGIEQFTLSAAWRDHPGEQNYYRLKIYKNGALQAGTYVLADDRLGDGETIMRPVIRETYSLGDTLRVQLLSVSKGYYDYFTDMANFDGRGLSAPTPFNPKSNWSGDILGYYGVWQVSEKTVVVR